MIVTHTWFGQRHEIGHILHENSALKLQLGLSSGICEVLGVELVLRLVDVDVLTTQQDRFEKIHMVLDGVSAIIPWPHALLNAHLPFGILAISQVLAL